MQQRMLCRLRDGQINSWSAANGLVGRTIRSLVAARNGDLWIGSDSPGSIQCFRDGQFKSFHWPSSVRAPRAMAEDNSGNIWVGTSSGLLLRIDHDVLIDESKNAG